MRETERRQNGGEKEGREGGRRAGRELLLKLASDKGRKLQLFYQIVKLHHPRKMKTLHSQGRQTHHGV